MEVVYNISCSAGHKVHTLAIISYYTNFPSPFEYGHCCNKPSTQYSPVQQRSSFSSDYDSGGLLYQKYYAADSP
jgi:hypothetical protein